MTKYMHTLEGMPAQFYPKDGVCFNSRRVKLVGTLRQIRKEQAESMRLDIIKQRHPIRYGYVTVQV